MKVKDIAIVGGIILAVAYLFKKPASTEARLAISPPTFLAGRYIPAQAVLPTFAPGESRKAELSIRNTGNATARITSSFFTLSTSEDMLVDLPPVAPGTTIAPGISLPLSITFVLPATATVGYLAGYAITINYDSGVGTPAKTERKVGDAFNLAAPPESALSITEPTFSRYTRAAYSRR